MKYFIFGILLVHTTIAESCLEPTATSTTLHIQNHEGPIYVAPGENRLPTLCNQASTCDNRYPTTSNLASTRDNRYPTLSNTASTYDNRCPTTSNLGSTYVNRYPTLSGLSTFDNQSPQILHSSSIPFQSVCETDCKCVTKHQTAVPVAVNSVPQNYGNPGYCCPQYPEGYYGCSYPDGLTYCSGADISSCPKISETLIPLLKTYLSQDTCKNSCQCGQKPLSYY